MNRDALSGDRNDNPLLPVVLRLLRAQPAGISEYELLKQIEADGAHFGHTADEAQLALFQKHFLIMNALYRLQDDLWRDERVRLTIAPLRIAIDTQIESKTDSAAEAMTHTIAPHGDDALRAYYLDWQQFLATDSAAVTQLLASFWTRYAAHDQRADALATLQLDDDADWHAIKRQYRRLAAVAHPDRGGDAAQFLTIRAAYEALYLSER